jgi:hypothetical protein
LCPSCTQQVVLAARAAATTTSETMTSCNVIYDVSTVAWVGGRGV